jgi:hypothetical protein
MVAYLKTLRWTFDHGKGKFCAKSCKPENVEHLLKKGKWFWKKPAKPDLVTRQEMPGGGFFSGSRFQVSGPGFWVLGSGFWVFAEK